MMDAIGLCPSHTGAPGGKRTGQHRSHDVVGGPFAKACTDLIAEGCVISWRDRVRAHTPWAGEDGGARRGAHEIHLPALQAQRLGEASGGAALWHVLGGARTG